MLHLPTIAFMTAESCLTCVVENCNSHLFFLLVIKSASFFFFNLAQDHPTRYVSLPPLPLAMTTQFSPNHWDVSRNYVSNTKWYPSKEVTCPPLYFSYSLKERNQRSNSTWSLYVQGYLLMKIKDQLYLQDYVTQTPICQRFSILFQLPL